MKHLSLLRILALGTACAMPAAAYCASPIAYVGLAYGSSPSSSGPVTIDVPAATKNGDLMLAYIATQSATGAWLTAPSGWTEVTKTFQFDPGRSAFLAHREQ